MTATQTETAETETVAVLGAGGTMGFPIAHNIARAGIPVLDAIARRLTQGAKEHGDKDFSATCLTSTPEQH